MLETYKNANLRVAIPVSNPPRLLNWRVHCATLLGLRLEMVECQGASTTGTQQNMTSSETKFVDAVSEARELESSWKALEDLAGAVVGHRLFTVMTVDMTAGLARRAYSNHPAEYPVSGTKPIHRDAWFDVVHRERRSFVANSIEDIAQVFPDHALIASLGCASVLNLPVVLEGDLVATINLLDVAGHYTPERVASAEAQLAIPARLCCALAFRFDSTRTEPS
ncbi:MAG: GAF domain-containing protein [Devosia sp.]